MEVEQQSDDLGTYPKHLKKYVKIHLQNLLLLFAIILRIQIMIIN